MSRDLWGFKDQKDLEREVINMPDTILKEQISLLGDKTGYVLYGKASFITTNPEDIDFKLATIFNVIVPNLDNYRKTILIMYSNPEAEYPVSLTIGSSYEEDCEDFAPKYECKDKTEFEAAINEILNSNEVMDVIRILYSKASMLK